MNKRLSVLFVILMFVMSMVPMAFAEQGEPGPGEPQLYGVADGEDVPPPRPRPIPLQIMEDARVGKELREQRAEQFQERRDLAKETIQNARERYQNAKERYLKARERYQELRPKFIEAKEQLRKCIDVDSDECDQARSQLRQNGKQYLLHTADVVLNTLERVQSKVESSEDISEEEAEEILADLDEDMIAVEDAKSVIENLDEDSTEEDIKEAAETIRNAWQKTQRHLKHAAGRLIHAKLGNIVHRADNLGDKFASISERLEARGLDVSALEDLVEEYDALMDSTGESWEAAREKFQEAKDAEDNEDLVKEAHEYLRAANADLKEAKTLIREIVKEIKSLNNGSLDVEEVEDESDDEAEDEVDEEEEEETEDETEDESESEEETESEDETEDDEAEDEEGDNETVEE